MSIEIELPDDLNEEMDVLFIKPYSPEDSAYLQQCDSSDAALRKIFAKTLAADPDLQIFEDTVATVKTMLGLGGYIVGDDLILLHGDKAALLKAENSLKHKYTCMIDRLGNFLDFARRDGNVAILPEEKPTLH